MGFKKNWGGVGGELAPPYKLRGALLLFLYRNIIKRKLQAKRVTHAALSSLLTCVEVGHPSLVGEVPVDGFFICTDVDARHVVNLFECLSPFFWCPF